MSKSDQLMAEIAKTRQTAAMEAETASDGKTIAMNRSASALRGEARRDWSSALVGTSSFSARVDIFTGAQ
ncbi:hypothetical protein [Caballeronia sp. M23-90]